jgi:hypothetical protein
MGDHGSETMRGGIRRVLTPGRRAALVLVLGLAPLALRGAGLVDWPWAVALAPLAAFGLISPLSTLVRRVGFWLRDSISILRPGAGPRGETPVPEFLEPVHQAEGTQDRILAEHPEILAAICLGMRHKPYAGFVLGHDVRDPWGVYEAAHDASAEDLEELRHAAAHHVRAFQERSRMKLGRSPAPSRVLKQTVGAFRKCAIRAEAGRNDVECTFEHLATIYGVSVPSRDRHLKDLAPRVRHLLERQYPQLATAQLADGSAVKFEEWREQAAAERRELKRLRREHQRLEERLEEAQDETAEARAETETLRASLADERARAHREARAEREQDFEELREMTDARAQELQRQLHRMEVEHGRLKGTIDELTAERRELEEALFPPEDDEGGADVDPSRLAGLRVLLVGGYDRQVAPLREALEAHGAQLLHEDSYAAVELVTGVKLVVIWIRYVSHSVSDPVRRECKVRGVPVQYWPRTSSESFVRLVSRGVERAGIPAAAAETEPEF